MTRRKLAIIAGIALLAAALLLMLWPDGQVDTHADEEAAEAELPEGLVLIGEEQIRAAEIEVAAVQTGAAVELVFPATGDRYRWQADQFARRFESGGIRGGGIYAYLCALAQKVIHQPVERLVRAIANVVVVAAEQGHAQVRTSHCCSP